jgi:hypothetical protein
MKLKHLKNAKFYYLMVSFGRLHKISKANFLA